jgi:hypothetical protein
MTSKVRLISVSGPAQLINVIAILKYQLENEEGNWEDHLILGWFCTGDSDEATNKMIDICTKIANSWDFKSIKYLSDKDLSSSYSFPELVERVRKKIELNDVSRLYVCRNWQVFNEVILEAYKHAMKICYGDGYGLLDLGDGEGRWRLKSVNPKGYSKLDKAYLFIPIEGDRNGKSFSLIEIIQPPIDYLTSTIENISSSMTDLEIYTNFLLSKSTNRKFTLVTTSNLSEAGFMRIRDNDKTYDLLDWFRFSLQQLALGLKGKKITSLKKRLFLINNINFEFAIDRFSEILEFSIKLITVKQLRPRVHQEVSMYIDQILRCCHKSEFIVIKSHPREIGGQASQLSKLLSQEGYNVALIDNIFSCLPIELFFKYLRFSKVVSLFSSSSLTAKLVLEIEDSSLFPFIDSDITEKYVNEFHIPILQEVEPLYLDLLKQIKLNKILPLRLIDYK